MAFHLPNPTFPALPRINGMSSASPFSSPTAGSGESAVDASPASLGGERAEETAAAADKRRRKPASSSPAAGGGGAGAGTGAAGVADIGSALVPGGKALGEPVIELFGVQKDYRLEGGEVVPVLHSISLHTLAEIPPIRRGEFLMIRGASGSGKTTLLNLIGTVDRPTKGKIKILGSTVDEKTSDAFLADLRLRTLGFVFQQWNLLANLTALENVTLPMDILGELPEKKRKERAIKLLRMVDLEDRQHHLPSELSGGEQQRVAVARALANSPPVLLGDELTASLDVANSVRIMDLLLKLNKEQGVTIVMVTHNADLECYADRILYVSDGRIIGSAINSVQSKLHLPSYLKYLNDEGE